MLCRGWQNSTQGVCQVNACDRSFSAYALFQVDDHDKLLHISAEHLLLTMPYASRSNGSSQAAALSDEDLENAM